MPLEGDFRPFPWPRGVTINSEGEGVLMRSLFVRTLLVSVVVLSWTFAAGATGVAAVSPVPPLLGVIPSEGFALLTVSTDLEPTVAVTVLSDNGCDASWITVSADGEFLRYRLEGEVDDGFPDELTAGSAILVLCSPVVSDLEAPTGGWQLVSLSGTRLVDGTSIDVDFSDGVVSGSGGCNGYSGGYEVAGDELVLGQPIASTAMACEPAILDQELAYFVALQAVERFSVSGDTLTIETGSGDLTFLRAGVEPTGDWLLMSLAADAVLAVAPITASFDGEVVAGSAGCNQYNGGYVVDGLAIALEGPIAATRMACETAIMDQETTYLAALAGATRFSMSGDTLTIETGSGDLTFLRAGVEPTGDWSLTSLVGDSVLVEAPITASFDGEVVAGSAGCNQ